MHDRDSQCVATYFQGVGTWGVAKPEPAIGYPGTLGHDTCSKRGVVESRAAIERHLAH
jgi:hypothetical protein